MKSIGEKGEGKWQRISPEEALDTIALKIRWAKLKKNMDRSLLPSSTVMDREGISSQHVLLRMLWVIG
jgi:anaerobic selenocysteine-containing dehydrogenase